MEWGCFTFWWRTLNRLPWRREGVARSTPGVYPERHFVPGVSGEAANLYLHHPTGSVEIITKALDSIVDLATSLIYLCLVI